MNFYGYVLMPIEKNKRVYHIELPVGAPYSECIEVLDEAKAGIQELIDKEKQAADEKNITAAHQVSDIA